ncbi:MAG: hypothetical protein FJW20_00020 [Acidimicrobiia bacterium]|nr:hypothetical protein [Acidimicrobiia bacterium]
MSRRAIGYIWVVVIAGLAVVTYALLHWTSVDPGLFTILLAAAAVVSTLKVRLPGLLGNITPGSFFLLLAIGRFSLPEAVVLGAVSATVQSLINTKKRPRPEQLAFNISTLALATVAAWIASRPFAWADDRVAGLLVGLLLAAPVYYLLNTVLVAGVITLTSGRPFDSVWSQCHMWNSVYYVIVVPLAGVAWFLLPSLSWRVLIVLLPSLWLLHTSCRFLAVMLAEAAYQPPMKEPAIAEPYVAGAGAGQP